MSDTDIPKDADNPDTPSATRNCTVCKKPVKGHEGPCGPGKCMNSSLLTPQDNMPIESSEEAGLPAGAASDPGLGDVLKALVSEMSNLNVGLQNIVAGQADIKRLLSSSSSAPGSQSGHASVGSTSQHVLATPRQHGSGPYQNTVTTGQAYGGTSPSVADRLLTMNTNPSIPPGPIPAHQQLAHPLLQDMATNRLPNGAVISNKTKNAAISGEFVTLSDFLPTLESYTDYETTVCPVQGSLQVKPRRNKRNINNFLTWLEAWNSYEELILQYHPSAYKACHHYRGFIMSSDKKYHWYAVSAFDNRFRALKGQNRSFAFDDIDTELYVTTLDATVTKMVPRCFRCRSPDHEVQDCPFPEVPRKGQQTAPTSTSAPRPRSEGPMFQGREVCLNYNNKRCKFANCRRAHVCTGCRGSTPRVDCPTCNSSRTATFQPNNSGTSSNGNNPTSYPGFNTQLLGPGMGAFPTT